MSKLIASKKYKGVMYAELQNGDKSYYIAYKIAGKLKREHIGKKSEGINEAFCHQKRNDAINKAKFGDDTPIVKYKKQITVMVNDIAESYFEDKAHENRSNTKQKGRYDLHLRNSIGETGISQLTKDDVLRLRNGLKESGKAPKTVNGIIQLLSAIFNYSIKHKGLKVNNPCSGINRLKVDDHRERYLTKKEIVSLKKSIDHDPILKMFVSLSLITGGRLETIMSIQKKDINLTNDTVTLKDHKNNSTYIGFLDREAHELIASIYQALQSYDFLIGGSAEKFPTRTLQRKMQKVLNKLFNEGLDPRDAKNRAVIHTLRHTFASQLAIAGTPIFTIQKLMNHADIQQTMRYAKLAPDSGKEHVKSLYS